MCYHYSIQHCHKSYTMSTRQDSEIKDIKTGKEKINCVHRLHDYLYKRKKNPLTPTLTTTTKISWDHELLQQHYRIRVNLCTMPFYIRNLSILLLFCFVFFFYQETPGTKPSIPRDKCIKIKCFPI